MRQPKQPVSIDGIEFDALMEQSISYEAEIPEYPTEKGFNVSDNINLKPENISMTLYVSETPVTWYNRFGSGIGRVDQVVKRLQDLYFAKKVISVTTSDAVFDDMAIVTMSITKSTETGYACEIPITMKKVIVTEAKTVYIPSSYGRSGTSSASAGTANTGSGKTGNSGSSVDTSSSSSSSASNSSNRSSNGSSSSRGGSILYNSAKKFGLL